MRLTIRTAAFCLLIGLALVLMAPTSFAVEANTRESITMSPVKKNYRLNPGEKKADELTIVNDGNVDYTFSIYTRPYSVRDENYEPDFFTVKTNTDIDAWIAFPKKSYTIAAGQTQKIPFTVTVPADAVPGGHYGVIFAETQPASSRPTTNSVERKKRVGSLIYATVNGDFKTGGSFTGIDTPTLQFKPPLTSAINVENTGDSDFAVDTVFAVSDLFGNRKYTETKQFQLLPRTTRKIMLSWDNAPGFGIYHVTTSAKFLDKTTTKTSHVLMAPLAYYMVFIVGLLVAVIYFVAKRR